MISNSNRRWRNNNIKQWWTSTKFLNKKSSQIPNLKNSQATELMNDRIKHKKFTPQTSWIIKCTKFQSLNFKNSRFNIKHGFTKLKNTKVKEKKKAMKLFISIKKKERLVLTWVRTKGSVLILISSQILVLTSFHNENQAYNHVTFQKPPNII
jgi:hypothetical protein